MRQTDVWRRVNRLLLIHGSLPAIVALVLIWWAPAVVTESLALRWTLTLLVLGVWAGCGIAARDKMIERLRTYSNMLTAVREGDYTVKVIDSDGDDPMSEMAQELRTLSSYLRERRLHDREAGALLSKVMAQIDAGVFAFDEDRRLRLVNATGARWLNRAPSDLIGVSSRVLGLDECLAGSAPRVSEMALPGGTARYEVRRATFRQEGRPHTLLLLHDLSRALAAEERLAWKRLIQVLRHEINNSLAPIQSIASTLRDKLQRDPRPAGWESDLAEGLEVIVSRSESLSRLTAAYAHLTRLPTPSPRDVDVRACLESVAALETRMAVRLASGPPIVIQADRDQLEQALINLVRNAVDAAQETGGGVEVGWGHHPERVDLCEIRIEDEGLGLADTENLFVPFFTTKRQGSGIGLVLSRHIIEAHDGSLTLEDRGAVRGCRVRIRLPIRGPV